MNSDISVEPMATPSVSPTTTFTPTHTATTTATLTATPTAKLPPQVTGISYTYDGDGNMVKSVIGDEVTYYISMNYEKQVQGIQQYERKYYFAGSSRIAMRENGTLTWLLSDHLGSTSVTADASGNLLSSLRYTAFGEVRAAVGATNTDYRYTGQRSEVEIGLYYYVARFYDPALGRFISADTVVPGLGNSVAWDRYAYSMNNPVNYNDPTGHWPEPPNFNFSWSSSSIGIAIDSFGNRIGISNGSQIVANVLSGAGLVLDVAAEATDIAATAIVTTAIVDGATAGAAITIPGGGTVVVGGGAGATAGWAMGELGVRGWITAGNVLATGATLLSATSDVISGKTAYGVNIKGSDKGLECASKLKIGSSTQVGTFSTIGGWIAPLTYPSLAMQTVAVAGDLGYISPPPINIETKSHLSFKERRFDYRIKVYQEK